MITPMSLKKALDMFDSVPIILEAPEKNTQKYLLYRGFSAMKVSDMFSWIRVVMPSSIVEDMIDLLNIPRAFVDYQVHNLQTRELNIDGKIVLPISYTTAKLDFDELYSFYALGKQYHITGKGVRAGVVDTGANRVFSKAIHTEASDILGLYDFNGHGTHVASTISAPFKAPKYAGIDMHGVAPDTAIYVYNAMALGFGNTSDIIKGIERLYSMGVKTINMSLGQDIDEKYDYSSDPLVNYIDTLCKHDKDMLFVVAAGNSGKDKLSTPAISPNTISVGSLSYTDQEIAFFSAYGEYTLPDGSVRKVPDIVSYGGGRADENTTPDELILAFTGANAADLTDGLQPNGFGLMHGTSQATPHATGGFVLMRNLIDVFNSGINLNAYKLRNAMSKLYSYNEGRGYGLFDKEMLSALFEYIAFDNAIRVI